MKITRNVFAIGDLSRWLKEKTLIVEHSYQRSMGLWPPNARSFFIDTILNGYPFPKITVWQKLDLRTRKIKREIVDGQQRITTIEGFIKNKIILSSVSKKYEGKTFSTLEEENQREFLSYEVSVDTIIGSSEEEVLEVFRRINSYTVPLNYPEKRHAVYQGEFKWFVKDIVGLYGPLFELCDIFTVRQISRMEDADLVTELCQILMEGIKGRSAAKLEKIYKENDKDFVSREEIEHKLIETLDYIKNELNEICSAKVLASYSFYSLFAALIYNKWGIAEINAQKVNNLNTIGKFTLDANLAIQNILEMFREVCEENISGRFKEFVQANLATTHSLKNRIIRLKWLVMALQNNL